MKTIKALLYISKEKKSIFRLVNSSFCAVNMHGLVLNHIYNLAGSD